MSVSPIPDDWPVFTSAGRTSSPRHHDSARLLTATSPGISGPVEHDPVSPAFDPEHGARTRRDFAYATAMVEAAERMQLQSELAALYRIVAAEAAMIIAADQTAVIRYEGIRRRVAGVHVEPRLDDEGLRRAFCALADARLLISPGTIDDLALTSSWVRTAARGVAVQWRSVMIVPVASPNPEDQTRLVWASSKPRHFGSQSVLPVLFARHASLAVRNLSASRTDADRPTARVPG